MPRAQKKCPKADCHQLQPCRFHPQGWASKTRKMPSDWAKVRKRILARDGHRCVLCGHPATSVDHIIPHSQGGTEDLGNLRALCDRCHKEKSDIEKNWRRRGKN